MRKDVTAASRHESFVLYDPAAIPPETDVDPDLDSQDPQPPPLPTLTSLADSGRALILRLVDEECQATFRLIVDEPVDSSLRERAVQAIDGAVLRIPSGRLVVDGVEFLCRHGERRSTSEAETIEIPAGSYRVEVLNLMPWIRRHRDSEIERMTSRFDRMVGRIVDSITWLGIILLPIDILLAPAVTLIAWMSSGTQAALAVIGIVVLANLVAFGLSWGIEFAQRWLPVLTRRRDVEKAFDAENPEIVVHLQQQSSASITPVSGMATLTLA